MGVFSACEQHERPAKPGPKWRYVWVGVLVLLFLSVSGPAMEPESLPPRASGIRLPNGSKLPSGWTKSTESVRVAAKDTTKSRTITYYISPAPVSMKFVYVPAGRFMMGSPPDEEGRSARKETPQHKVRITKPFLMNATEVTNAQYRRFFPSHDSREWDGKSFNGEDQPVVYVSWHDAVAFAQELSDEFGDALECRLPTEAEWEYACRAGTTTPFSCGETISTDLANYNGEHAYGSGHKGEWRLTTIVVGTFPANAWGLYDMHGNVWEWCGDWYDDYAKSAVDDPKGPKIGKTVKQLGPKGPQTGPVRINRGGSWWHQPIYCRAATRYAFFPEYTHKNLGIRVVVPLR